MIALLYCLFLLIGVVGIPAVLLIMVSTGLGVAATVVSVILGVPLLIATSAHADLVRVRMRYGLGKDELDEFVRLVPRLAVGPYRELSRRQRSVTAKRAAAEAILSRRTRRSPSR
jgi:hypothetical protein